MARLGRPHAISLATVAVAAAGLIVFRQTIVDPDAWDAACRAAAPPWPCVPRQAVVWLQAWSVWGAAALLLGGWALLGGPVAASVAGVICGVGGAVNYNVTWGVLGGSLSAWAWLRPADAGSLGWPTPKRRRSRPVTAGSTDLPAPHTPPRPE